ncbi:amidohydrolase [Cytophagales bacterium LB-30]|uniref:Amidohydrolase n=1 Tax=Shiella aurantiaca TaxID=3058365 RepID=A0ABT8F2B0_9BACT|nr:amidohydrolase [Shiella aurantiaca]MDN4164379.1 amidohydrolase [Shiella aurantiaca]
MKSYSTLLLTVLSLAFWGCNTTEKVDLVVYNANVYTVNANFDTQEAFAVKDGKFLAIGSNKEIKEKYSAEKMVDAEGKVVFPGFIDGHAHFVGYAQNLLQADLVGAESFSDMVNRVTTHRSAHPETQWILGRGWDQNDWPNKEFPTKDTLDALFPNTPVFLTRVDGHAALVNQKALDLAGITASTELLGGKVLVANGKATGVLIDNAVTLVEQIIPPLTDAELVEALMQAQKNCHAVGLTSLADAGLDKPVIDLLDSLQQAQLLKMRIYAMVTPSEANMNYYFTHGKYKTDFLNVRSFKVYGDGALGSRGACLLKPYHDDADNTGFLLFKPDVYESLAKQFYTYGFQMNTHCIGDSANRVILDIYGRLLPKENDLRWRIEHAQVVAKEEVGKFKEFNVIPSIQPTHATSDMYWAPDRLGEERIKTAYAYQDLKQSKGLVALGSDFPVEHINPLYGFHSAVARKDAKNWPEGGFQKENALSREDALRGMTIWAAFAQFEEQEKGSIEAGKLADFVILEKNIMEIPEEEIRETPIKATFVQGEQVF